jgi:carboxymethylenebutenolidase
MIEAPDKLGKIFDKHIEYKFDKKDVEATMTTMTDEPYVHHVPTLTGGFGYNEVYSFYKNRFVGKMPKDIKIEPISSTVGKDQVVDEIIISFTHDRQIEYMLPRVEPTGRCVEIPLVVIMKFDGLKIAHEHIYWENVSFGSNRTDGRKKYTCFWNSASKANTRVIQQLVFFNRP